MKVITAFRNLDKHGEFRAPQVIAEEVPLVEKRLTHVRPDLARLDATVSQTKGKTRIHASLRLELPSGIIAAQEDGFEIEPVLRKAFADLRRRLARHLARVKREAAWKRRGRRARITELLPAARDAAEAERRALYFDLIEDHLDRVHALVRRELAYLVNNGDVPAGRLEAGALIDATILRGLEEFENRPTEFSTSAWLTKLALDTIAAEAARARRAIPDDAASLDEAPEEPATDPTESDQEMFEFYQPDAVPDLEELIADEDETSPEEDAEAQETRLAVQRAVAGLPARWRRALMLVDLEDTPAEEAATIMGTSVEDLNRVIELAHLYLAERLRDAGIEHDGRLPAVAPMPLPVTERDRIREALGLSDEVAA